jgi:hypothetical protein
MKKVFLALMAASMFVACQSGKTQQTSATTTTTTAAVSSAPAVSAAPVTKADSAKAPVMKFAVESFNFGKIKAGDKVSYDFKFTNVGKSPLIVTDAVATCGCTKPEWPKEPIEPNAEGIIKVTFNSANKSGLQDKMIQITANTLPAQNIVHLVGEVTTTK